MPKYPTYPTLYDECKTISISNLKQWKFLTVGEFKSGIISWSRNGEVNSRISISVSINPFNPHIKLDYLCNEIPITYIVYLASIPSNLGKGVIWYFVCPQTGKHCRKLYLVDTYFYHRSAFRYCMYDKQTKSHKSRNIYKLFDRLFSSDGAYEKIYSKHFKKKYRGKPTKRYLKLLKQAEASVGISELELLLLN
ncbi:MAG: hypothetical protein WCH34_05405 [Bacteroidota bacterium]